MEADDRQPARSSAAALTALAGLRGDLVRFFSLSLGAVEAGARVVNEIQAAILDGRLPPTDRDLGATFFEFGSQLVRDQLRAQLASLNEQSAGSNAGDLLSSAERLGVIVEVLKELPPDALLVLRLHKFEGQSFSTIARALDVTIDEVEHHIAAALRLLLLRGL